MSQDRVTTITQEWRKESITEVIEDLSASPRQHWPDIEERRDERIEFTERVRIVPTDHCGVPCGPAVAAAGRDLSRRGICVSSPRPFVADDHLAVEFVLPMADDRSVVSALFRVRHVRSEGGQAVLGCEYVKPLEGEVCQAKEGTSTMEVHDADVEGAAIEELLDLGETAGPQPKNYDDIIRWPMLLTVVVAAVAASVFFTWLTSN